MNVSIANVLGWGYFVYINSMSNHDYTTCKYLKMQLKEYQQYLIKNFNGKINAGDIYFENLENAQQAKEWIDSVFLYQTIKGEIL